MLTRHSTRTGTSCDVQNIRLLLQCHVQVSGDKVSRAAQIHREIAALHVELAELASNDTEAPAVEPKRRKVRVHPGPVNPDRTPSDIDAARAARMLRRRGIGA